MLVGWGETQDAMRALAAGLGVEDRVIFTGFRVDGFQDVYRGMDFFVQLAEGHDTSCRSVVEAMASGLPVILARRGIMGELIDDGVEGLLAGADCGPDELASLVERLSADAGTRHAMGVAASARVASNSLPAVTDRFLEIIA
jgi:glycosyltransferase involved in cell wall biosynthesis